MDKIQVSVVVPTYNRSSQIVFTLESVLNQTLAPQAWELIVIDDGSTDDTVAWAKEFLDGVANARVIQQRNAGVAQARNRGWREARGEWVAFLDHDDLFHPNKLETLLKLATEKNDVIVPRWSEIGIEGHKNESTTYGTIKNTFSWLMGWDNPIVSMSVPLVRRSALKKIGGFDPRCVPADDWDLWLRLAKTTEFTFSDEVLVDYSLHDGQQRRNQAKMFRAVRRVLGKHAFELASRPLLFWWYLWSGAFVASLPAYESAKEGAPFLATSLQATRSHFLALLSPQWVALWARNVRTRR